jgi:hypothetical protein
MQRLLGLAEALLRTLDGDLDALDADEQDEWVAIR